MRHPRGLLLTLTLTLTFTFTFTFTRTAHAQNTQGNTFNLQLFRPAVDSKGYFTVNASQILGHLDFSIGLIGTYANTVLELRNPSVMGISGMPANPVTGEAAFRV